MNLEDALQLFMKRIDIIVSMEMGGKIPTKEAYKEIKDEVRKLKKNKKHIHHEKVTAPPEPQRVAIGRFQNRRTTLTGGMNASSTNPTIQ